MVPTWDYKDPQEFRDATKKEILARYSTIQFVDVEVTNMEKNNDSHFKVTDGDRKEWDFRKIILAVGVDDIFPEIEGYAELWSRRM